MRSASNAVLVPTDRQGSLHAGHANRIPDDRGPARNILLDISCRVAGDLHFRHQTGNRKHQILIQVTGKDRATSAVQRGVRDRQHWRQIIVPDDGAVGAKATWRRETRV